jgi:F-type H+-transporting ATPase subunit alpha
MRLADEVALVLAVQSGVLDPLSLPAVTLFRQGLSEILDRDVPDIVHHIQETGALNDSGKQAIRGALRKYVQTLTPAAGVPRVAGKP